MFEVITISFAFFFGLAVRQIGLPPLVGFLAAGFAIKAFAGGLGFPEYSGKILDHVAHLGVLLLLFTVGLLLAGDALGTSESLLYLTGGGPGTRTFMPGLYAYNKAITAGNWLLGATASWCIVIGALLLGLLYLRLARRGGHA